MNPNQTLNEGFLPGDVDKAVHLMAKYIKKHTGITFFRMQGIEEYEGDGHGYGIRLFSSKSGYSLRLNFSSKGLSQNALTGFSFWHGYQKKSTKVTFARNISIVKILPVIVNVLNGNAGSTVHSYPAGIILEDIEDSYELELTEARSSADPLDVYNQLVALINKDPNKFSKSQMFRKLKSLGKRFFETMVDMYPESIYIGKRGYVIEEPALSEIQDPSTIFAELGIVTGTVKTVNKERYAVNPEVEKIEADKERISFEMQLDDMKNLLKLTLSGSSNAMFVAGRGGIGKTYGVEEVLHKAGLQDGAGYFKNTGSISTAGLYSMLFKHRNGIVLFDDSDDVFKDQSSRNILKAATDTKKIRKLVWNKMGSNVADPDEMTYDEIEDEGLIPRFFEFTGKIIFISNLPMKKLDPDGAIRTRAFLIDIDPTEEEVYDFMDKICEKMPIEEGFHLDAKDRHAVVEMLRNSTGKQSANLRKLSRGLNMMAGAIASGINVNDKEMQRLIESYA